MTILAHEWDFEVIAALVCIAAVFFAGPWSVTTLIRYALMKRRTTELRGVAKMWDVPFSTSGTSLLASTVNSFRIFPSARTEKVGCLLELDEALLFDLYRTSHAPPLNSHLRTRVRLTFLLCETPLVFLPEFTLRPKAQIDLRRILVDQKDIEFPSDSKFSSRYSLRGNGRNHEAVRQLFDDKIVSFVAKHHGVWLAGKGTQLLYCWGEQHVGAKDVDQFVRLGRVLQDLLRKRHLAVSTTESSGST